MITTEEPMLFPWIEKQIQDYLVEHSLEKKDLINLGIGDTCHTLPQCIAKALHTAVDEMQNRPIGYGDELGNKALRERICKTVYAPFDFTAEEVIITEGIANSLSHLVHLFPEGSKFGVMSPTYPVYKSLLQVSRMDIIEIAAEEDLSFSPPTQNVDAMILCSPNNPTGIAFSKARLQAWVDWAKETDTLLLFDGAYESFIDCENTPRSIYEIEGAKSVAIEMRSFSKSLGFSGLRLGYFAVPKEISKGTILKTIRKMVTARTNGVSYVIQQAGLAALSEEGLKEIERLSTHYMEMTQRLKKILIIKGYTVLGGEHAPYLFVQIEGCSKEKFKHLLQDHRIITVPGLGFGMDGYLRLSGFINDEVYSCVVKSMS